MRALLAVLLITACIRVHPQDASRIAPDLKRLEEATTDSARIVLLNWLCFNYADKNPAKGVEYGERALALANRTNDERGIMDAHSRMGYCCIRLSEFAKADSLCGLAVEGFERIGDRCAMALALMNLGLSKEMRQDNAGALEYFQKALREEDACPESSQRSALLYASGGPYEKMGRFDEALANYRRAFAIDSARHDTARLAKDHIAIANMLGALKLVDQAMIHYERSIQCSQAIGDTLVIGYVWYNCAEIEKNRGRVPEALAYGERSVAVFTQLDRRAELLHAKNFLGTLYLDAARPSDAASVLADAIALSHELGIREERMQALRTLAAVRKAQDDPAGALRNYEAYMALKDSLDADAQQARLAELTEKYGAEKKEQELAIARAENSATRSDAQRQRTMKLIYLISAGALALLLVVSFSRYRLKQRATDELARTNAEVLKQKERAEESERAKDRFLANVSHEIRTPLNAIMGFTGLLLHEHRDERTARFLSSIREAGDNLLVVINDVLDISRIEAGKLTLVNEPYDLHRCVELCIEILHHRAEEQGNTLVRTIAPNVPRWVYGDSARMLQILLNLAGNALKFTTNGEVRIALDHQDQRLRIRITDTGIGIPPEKLATVFDRFSQVDATDQRKHSGAGLGLAIVKELVQLHTGTLQINSEVGKGTEVIVALPVQASERPAASAPSHILQESSGTLAGRTVLVAEDNEMNALVTTETMRRYYPGAVVELVRTGREALRHMEQDVDGDTALVLMDVQMPEMDGMTATRRIRALDGDAARVPVIALTASVLPSDLSRCLDAGMDACVSKPFKAEELILAIARLTGDGGAPTGVGYDVHDPRVALYHWLVPTRLKALSAALAANDPSEVKLIVHSLRPQLVERDAERFAPLCDQLLRMNGELSTQQVNELIAAIEASLA